MASYDGGVVENDGTIGDNSKSDSGYLHVAPIPTVIAIDVSTLKDTDRLRKELEKSKEANKQLRTSLRGLNKKLLDSEEEFKNERRRFRSSQDTIMQLRKRNTDLLKQIEEYENTIKVLESNEKILHEKLAGHEDKQTNELLERERKKTKETEKELEEIKQRVQKLEQEIEIKNKLIDKKTIDEGKLNKKLEQNANDIKEVKEMLKKGEAREAEKDRKIDDMSTKLDDVLRVVSTLSSRIPPLQTSDKDGTNTNTHQRSKTNTPYQVDGRFPGVDTRKNSTIVSKSYDGGTRLPPVQRNKKK